MFPRERREYEGGCVLGTFRSVADMVLVNERGL